MMEVFYKKLTVLQAQHLSRVPGREEKKKWKATKMECKRAGKPSAFTVWR